MNVIHGVNYTPTDNRVKRLQNHTLNYISPLHMNKSYTYPQCTGAGDEERRATVRSGDAEVAHEYS